MFDDTHNFSINFLKERAKELECLYLVDEALTKDSLKDIMMEISVILPKGFCHVNNCRVAIVLDNQIYSDKPVISNGIEIQSTIMVNHKVRGYIKASYIDIASVDEDCVFLVQEEKLLNTVAKKISQIIYQKEIQNFGDPRSNWRAILTLLQKTNQSLLLHVCEKMITLLAKNNQNLLMDIYSEMNWSNNTFKGEINFPHADLPAVDVVRLSKSLFKIAKTCMDDSQIFDYLNLWIYQNKTYELIKLVDKRDSDVGDINKALILYVKAVKSNEMSSKTTKRWLTVELVRRFLTDKPKLIENARKYVTAEDFCDLLDNIICSPKSKGSIGGKATGFFLANKIIQSQIEQNPIFKNIKETRTWYISSDELEKFLHDNHLDELNEHKYHDILEVRLSYPKIVQSIKNSKLSPYVLNQLNQILDNCDNKPLIIRSSSLLEDQIDSTFSGKYRSLFLTNTGTKAERLKSLVDGILEVYASMFSPDSIQYRKERNLLDSSEQMGIMIQEVVGRKIGPYYFPLYAGVAFSNNEFRWSPRLKREDGLMRMVVGLGTRAVDRVGDDFPILISPGQPKLRVNQVPEEIQKYSPQMMDVLDVENNKFQTVPILDIIRNYGNEIPYINHIASVLKDDFISEFNKVTTDFETDNIIITFDSLINKTQIIEQVRSLLILLQKKLGYPVDIEFASDGEYFYLLQCRPQSQNRDNYPVAIPTNISKKDMVFTANKYISNGIVAGIKSVVYVDPEEYGKLENHQDLLNVGNAISELNSILFRRSFILMGPGRWGSRGDIKLGVQVTYSDINNASMLIEIAKTTSKHQPELSFGTHFFQDLVEADIKYLPLYPDNKDIFFDNNFFTKNTNELSKLLPSYAYLSDVIKVIFISENYFKKELIVLMNAELEKAIAYIGNTTNNEKKSNYIMNEFENYINIENDDQMWKWRHYMAEKISSQIDLKEFSVKGIYLFGSTNTCTAKLNSDIDLLIHIDGSEEQKQKLDIWLKGWSMALSEINYLKTGYKSDGLLDIHYVTDKDIEGNNSYASKINSIYDPPTLLRLRED